MVLIASKQTSEVHGKTFSLLSCVLETFKENIDIFLEMA